MKHIPMKVTSITVNGQTAPLDYKAQLIAIVSTPTNPQGSDYQEIRKSIRLLDIFEKANDVLEIEDADYAYLCERVKGARYLVIDRAVMQFIEDVTNPT